MANLANANGHRTQQTTMPPKAHRAAGGLVRTHSRTSSGGGSRVGLSELRLTQKEQPPRYPDKPKKNGHPHHEGPAKNLPRTNSGIRVHSREHVNVNQTARRAPTPLKNNVSDTKQKAGFTISSPSEEGDEDGWVSSESGAATPRDDSDDVDEEVVTPIEKQPKPKLPPNAIPNGFVKDDHPTPRADFQTLPRIDTVKLADGLVPGPPPTSRDYAPAPPFPAQPPAQSNFAPAVALGFAPQPPTSPAFSPEPASTVHAASPPPPQSIPPVTKARSETHSPPRRSPSTCTRSMTRPPSTHSISSSSQHHLRPHPLIRAHSIGYGAHAGPAKPAPLAPLTSSEQIPAEIPTSSPTSYRAVSPTLSMHTGTASPVLSQPSPTDSEASRRLRRTSLTSRSSGGSLPPGPPAVLPLQGSASHAHLGRTATQHDRQRTLSSASTFAALSSLNLGMRATPSPPKTPLQHVAVHFPPADQHRHQHHHGAHAEHVHPLLPPPYNLAHLTLLAYRNPLAESYERVVRAKQAR
ncbi:uncharacterized protein PHACADRAFT_209796 [Phanerochaete carnosa HHB-10118-sp]|uniref:Uncharacterized protein n=1 Tax=Phanerochaete carnosa (strain HHB-10118-sp) TaxID=650164 RepID=K5WU48_PHACS|nr:uncharacterized protein PHACADRAFT_209796 [Phanerochaete carnosa HHB-10118-sp]EKM53967.1 hypothetical protein PHACADRAFT_209796 [Phanerochaete carnosa HHB-10118-sp]